MYKELSNALVIVAVSSRIKKPYYNIRRTTVAKSPNFSVVSALSKLKGNGISTLIFVSSILKFLETDKPTDILVPLNNIFQDLFYATYLLLSMPNTYIIQVCL